jgi:hypothetical protein
MPEIKFVDAIEKRALVSNKKCMQKLLREGFIR